MESNTSIISQLKSTELFEQCDDATLAAVSSFCKTVRLEQGAVLFRQGDKADVLFIVVDGLLRIAIEQPHGGELQLAKVGPGRLIGEMHILNAGRRTATVVAEKSTGLLSFPYALFQEILDSSPPLQLKLNEIIHQRFRQNALAVVLTTIFGQKDALALHRFVEHMIWHEVKKGAYLFHQGDAGSSLFFVVSGLLQISKKESDEHRRIVGELKRGDCVGEMAMLSGNARSATVRALRDSELTELPKELFEQIVNRTPGILRTIAKTVVKRLEGTPGADRKQHPMMNIAVVQISPNVPFAHCLKRFLAELSVFGTKMHWNSERLDRLTQRPGVSQTPVGGIHHRQLSHWLDEREIKYQFNIFETDNTVSPWTVRCLERADRIYLFAHADDDAALSEI